MAAEFNPGVLTNKGIALLAKWQAGRCTPELTRAECGSGSYASGESIAGRTALKAPKLSVGFSRKVVQNVSTLLLRFIFGNESLVTGFKLTEVGIYATDPDEGEILYSIAVSANESNADYLPAYNGTYPSNIVFNYQVEVNNASTVTITAGSGAYASADDLNDLEDHVDALQTQSDDNSTAIRLLNQHLIIAREYIDNLETDVDTLKQNATGETGTVTMTNAKKFPFNTTLASGSTVALDTVRESLDYVVEITITAFVGGLPGNVTVSNKALNGFKLDYDGSATSVTVAYRVIGGFIA